MSKNNTELYSAYRISELMKSFKTNINVLESKQRGYIVTGDAKFLEAYKLKESETKTYLQSMEKYFLGKPEETAFYKLKELTYKKLTEVKDVNASINSNMQGGLNAPDINLNTMSEIISTVDDINESLSGTTKTLLDNSVEYVSASKNWSYLEISLGIFTALAAVVILVTDINTRNKLEDELRIAKHKADENAMLKEQFMANMSHEIRTPMNAILGFSDLLQKTNLTKAQEDYLLAVKTSGSNLLNIINDILDFSKIEAGKLNIENIPFNLLHLLNTLKVMFEPKASEKNINFKLMIDDKIPEFIFGDPTRLSQILINLINNAIKFTNDGSVIVSCLITSIDKQEATIVFKIKDSGIGISEDKINSVFERFNQGNAETTRMFGGTGLGLAIVKQLVEIQNGIIDLKSKEGVGSEFSVTMIYPISHEKTLEVNENINDKLHIKSSKPLNVLLVEDNVLNQKLTSIYLIGFGLQVELAENGLQALDKVKQTNYDLILMDIHMPLLDGYHTTKKIREELNKLETPIIAMTANVMSNEREKCLQFGMTDFIGKPFKENDLFNIVKKHVGSNLKLDEVDFNNNNLIEANQLYKYNFVDTEQLKALSRGNDNFMTEIVNIFLTQNPLELNQIEQAIEKEDYETIRSISHKMKTSVGFVGLKSILNELANLELAAEQKIDLEKIKRQFKQLKMNCSSATNELKHILENLNTLN